MNGTAQKELITKAPQKMNKTQIGLDSIFCLCMRSPCFYDAPRGQVDVNELEPHPQGAVVSPACVVTVVLSCLSVRSPSLALPAFPSPFTKCCRLFPRPSVFLVLFQSFQQFWAPKSTATVAAAAVKTSTTTKGRVQVQSCILGQMQTTVYCRESVFFSFRRVYICDCILSRAVQQRK